MLLPLIALVISSSACQNPEPSRKDSTAVLAGDTTAHILSPDSRSLVLRARELDRADSLEQARAAYEDAAKKLPQISDWLYLRAAGVTADSAARVAYFAKVRSAAARERIGWTDAIAGGRARAFAGGHRG
jgi:oligoendopeptidase F